MPRPNRAKLGQDSTTTHYLTYYMYTVLSNYMYIYGIYMTYIVQTAVILKREIIICFLVILHTTCKEKNANEQSKQTFHQG